MCPPFLCLSSSPSALAGFWLVSAPLFLIGLKDAQGPGYTTTTPPCTHTHTHGDSVLLYSSRGEWLTCGKISLECREREKRAEKASKAVLCGMKTAMMANIPLLITACLLCAPQAFRRSQPTANPVYYFLTPHLSLFLQPSQASITKLWFLHRG